MTSTDQLPVIVLSVLETGIVQNMSNKTVGSDIAVYKLSDVRTGTVHPNTQVT